MRYGSEHKAETRQRVLREAAKAIREQGVDRIGVSQIMARAGLTHGGFYAHFTSKEDLISETLGYMFDDQHAAFLAHLDEPDVHQALIRFVEGYVSMAHRNSTERGCPIPSLAGQIPQLSDAARETFLSGTERLKEGLASLLKRAGKDYADTLAVVVIAEMVGAVSLARMERDDAGAEKLLKAIRRSIFEKLDLLD